MMKKMIGLLLLVTMLATAVFAVSVSADTTELKAHYADTVPTIDGTIDEIWNKTQVITFQHVDAKNYVKLLWTEEGTYFLAVLPDQSSIAIAVTEKKYTESNAAYWWDNDAGYGFSADKTGKVTSPNWYTPKAEGLVSAVVAYEEGFILEAFVPHTGNFAYKNQHQIGFGAHIWGANQVSVGAEYGFDNNSTSAGKLAAVKLVDAPCKNHDYAEATCQTPRTCKLCGLADPDNTALDPNKHTGEQKCKNAGEKHETYWDCCNATVETTDHEWSGTTTVKREATCTLTKQVIDTCTKCGAEKVVEETPALGHEPGEWTTMTAATCTKEGFEYITCKRCWETVDSRSIEKLAHTPGEWIVDQEAAVGVAGSRHRNCTVCAAKLDTEELEALPEPKKSGCKGSVSASFCLIPAAMAVAVVARRRKKEQ